MVDIHQITVGNKVIGSTQYGSDYMTEFRRIMQDFTVDVTGNFLEWGAGHTTIEIARFAKARGSNLFLTIDNNVKYLDDVLSSLKEFDFLSGKALDLTGLCVNQSDRGLNYSTFPLSLGKKFDFIYIDGRRRNECSMTSALLCHENTIVVVHDYRRERYQPMKAFFDIVEDGSQFRVMRLRKTILNTLNEVAPLISEAMF
jgi:hypothetical protein